MSAIDELLARHRAFLATRSHQGLLGARPKLRIAILTCMDARIDITAALGLRPGDVHVLRNAGGLVTDDALRSLVVSQRVLGTEEIMVVMHSDCGMLGLHDADLAGRVAAETQVEVPFAFGGFPDLHAQLRASVDRLGACPWLPSRGAVRGFVYDVDTGAIHEPAAADTPAPS
jgi:carbonic anhydrase